MSRFLQSEQNMWREPYWEIFIVLCPRLLISGNAKCTTNCAELSNRTVLGVIRFVVRHSIMLPNAKFATQWANKWAESCWELCILRYPMRFCQGMLILPRIEKSTRTEQFLELFLSECDIEWRHELQILLFSELNYWIQLCLELFIF